MKKILTILLVSLMVLSLTGCNSKKEEPQKVEEPVIQETVKEEAKEEATTEPVVEEAAPVEVVEEVKEEKADVTQLSYWVNFLNYDGSVISRKTYKYGSTPVAPLNPTYEDGVIYYNFLEWDKKLTPVYGTQTYTALYEKTGYVKYDEPSVSVSGSTEKKISLSILTSIYYDILSVGYSCVLEYDDSLEYEDGEKWSQYLDRFSNDGGFKVTLKMYSATDPDILLNQIVVTLGYANIGGIQGSLGLFGRDSEGDDYLAAIVIDKDYTELPMSGGSIDYDEIKSHMVNVNDTIDEADGKLYFYLQS